MGRLKVNLQKPTLVQCVGASGRSVGPFIVGN